MGGGGGATNTRKMFRPAPSYFVSSLDFNKSNRRLGSRVCPASFLPPLFRAGVLALCLFLEVEATREFGVVAVTVVESATEEPPPKKSENCQAATTIAMKPSDAAAMTFFRLSAPIFTKPSSNTFPA